MFAADEEGETCLHLAFARHAATINLDHTTAIQQVFHKAVSHQCSQCNFSEVGVQH